MPPAAGKPRKGAATTWCAELEAALCLLKTPWFHKKNGGWSCAQRQLRSQDAAAATGPPPMCSTQYRLWITNLSRVFRCNFARERTTRLDETLKDNP